jgi:hypothetical protein
LHKIHVEQSNTVTIIEDNGMSNSSDSETEEWLGAILGVEELEDN